MWEDPVWNRTFKIETILIGGEGEVTSGRIRALSQGMARGKARSRDGRGRQGGDVCSVYPLDGCPPQYTEFSETAFSHP